MKPILLTLLLSLSCIAQTAITGKVADAKGKAYANGDVTWQAHDSKAVVHHKLAADGSMPAKSTIAPGVYTVIIRAKGQPTMAKGGVKIASGTPVDLGKMFAQSKPKAPKPSN